MQKISLFIVLLLASSVLFAQEFEDLKKEAEKTEVREQKKDDKKTKVPQPQQKLEHRFAQVSLFRSISTNGSNYENTENNFSLNLSSGKNGALKGIEIGILANEQDRYARGLQIASLANVAGTGQSGIQVAGMANVAGSEQTGIQLSAFANVAGTRQSGLQISGFTNVAGGASYGIQLGGLANVSGGRAKGIQVAGLSNVVGGQMSGILVSGLANVVGDESNGLLIAGLSNVTSNMRGINIAGLGNVAENMKGIQIAGIYNRAKTASGLLISTINQLDSLNGVLPIGLVTIVKKDRHRAFGFEANELLYANITFRNGARKWYNVYSVGAQFGETTRWGIGFGFGSKWYLGDSETWFTRAEATATQLNENEAWTNKLNLVNRLQLHFGSQNGSFSWFVGPSLNVYTSTYKEDGAAFIGSEAVPYTLYDNEATDGTALQMWVGASAGVSFSF